MELNAMSSTSPLTYGWGNHYAARSTLYVILVQLVIESEFKFQKMQKLQNTVKGDSKLLLDKVSVELIMLESSNLIQP